MRRRVGGETSTCIHVYRYKSQLRSAEKCATLSCRVAGDAPRACVCPAALKPLSSCTGTDDSALTGVRHCSRSRSRPRRDPWLPSELPRCRSRPPSCCRLRCRISSPDAHRLGPSLRWTTCAFPRPVASTRLCRHWDGSTCQSLTQGKLQLPLLLCNVCSEHRCIWTGEPSLLTLR